MPLAPQGVFVPRHVPHHVEIPQSLELAVEVAPAALAITAVFEIRLMDG